MTQLDLTLSAPAAHDEPRSARASRPTTTERFASFNTENPHVFAEMLQLARAWLDRGDRYISVKAIFEALRTRIATHGDEYRLNNDYTQCVARELIRVEPRLASVIRLRASKP